MPCAILYFKSVKSNIKLVLLTLKSKKRKRQNIDKLDNTKYSCLIYSVKSLILLLLLVIPFSCINTCDCYYVVYQSNPTNNYKWKQTYISTWDASCVDELLSQSTYTDISGEEWYSKTWIECD